MAIFRTEHNNLKLPPLSLSLSTALSDSVQFVITSPDAKLQLCGESTVDNNKSPA